MSGHNDNNSSKILNTPVNKIKEQVLEYMKTENYIVFSKLIFPVDRALYIYQFNYKTLTVLLENNNDFFLFDDKAIEQRNDMLMDGMVYLHNFISAQFSLVDVLTNHIANTHTGKRPLGEINKLKNRKINKFFRRLRNSILHQFNFAPTLRYNSQWEKPKIAYAVHELLIDDKWSDELQTYIKSFGDYLIIEDIVNEHHNHMVDFLNNYESIIFQENTASFQEVINTLLNFAKQYKDINENGFLPVSESYLIGKLKFLPN